MNYRILFIIFSIVILTEATPVYVQQVFTGKIDVITSFDPALPNSAVNKTASFSHALGAGRINPSGQTYGLSLINFSGYVSSQFSFNATIMSYTNSSMVIQVIGIGNTYFSFLSFHYITANFFLMEIQRACYQCNTNLTSGSGYRQQVFSNLTANLTNNKYLSVQTTIYGIKSTNTQGSYHMFQVFSWMDPVTQGIYNIVKAWEYTSVEWICMTILIYDTKPAAANAGYITLRQNSAITQASGITQFAYNPIFYAAYQDNFFGFSMMKIGIPYDTTRNFYLATDDPSDIRIGFQTNANNLQLNLIQFLLFFDNCISPTSFYSLTTYTCSASCSPGLYPDASYVCRPCASSCLTCNGTTSSNCTNCIPGTNRVVVSGVCNCTGIYVDVGVPICGLCSTYMPQCIQCTSTTVCQACNGTFSVNATNMCSCLATQFLVNGICSPLIGCLLLQNITTGLYCDLCDNANNYYLVNATQTCQCGNHTTYDGTICHGICNDGYLSTGEQCDDGNNSTGDGCSNCIIDIGYSCQVLPGSTKSTCVKSGSFSLTYLYTQKTINKNTATIVFQFSPSNPSINSMNFTNYLHTSIPNSAFTATYSPTDGLLSVTIDYTQSIQGTNQSISLSFDPSLISAPTVSVNLTTTGSNYLLVLDTGSSFVSVLQLLTVGVGMLALLGGLTLSVLGWKLMGLEILLPVQTIFFMLSFSKVPSPEVGALQSLTYSTGYNQIISFGMLQNYKLSQGLINIGFQREFLVNYNFMAVPLGLIILVVIVYRLLLPNNPMLPALQKEKKDDQHNEKQQKIETIQEESKTALVTTLQKQFYFIVDRLLIFFLAANMNRIAFAFSVQMTDQTIFASTSFTIFLNSFISLLLMAFAVFTPYFIWSNVKSKGLRLNFQCKSAMYPCALIAAYLFINLTLANFFMMSAGIYIAIILSFLPLLIFFICRPYQSLFCFDSIIAIVDHSLVILASFVLLISNSSSSLSSTMCLALAFAIIGGIFIMQVLTVIRLIRVMKCCQKKAKTKKRKLNQQTQEVELVTKQAIKSNLLSMNHQDRLINWEEKNNKEYESIKMKKEEKQYRSRGKHPKEEKRQKDSKDQKYKKDEEDDSQSNSNAKKLQSEDEEESIQEDQLVKLKRKLKLELKTKRGFL